MLHNFRRNGVISYSDDAVCLHCHHSYVYLRLLNGNASRAECEGYPKKISAKTIDKTVREFLEKLEKEQTELVAKRYACFHNLGEFVSQFGYDAIDSLKYQTLLTNAKNAETEVKEKNTAHRESEGTVNDQTIRSIYVEVFR